jgi:hypothetical protein
MPRYYPKKPNQTESRYEITTSENKFLLTVRESNESDSVMIYIGGIDTYCLECQLFKHSTIANLPKIMYDEKCSLTGRFERGTDVIRIMSLLITYILDTYPHVTTITFDDFSTRECEHGIHIDLAPFYYAFHNETWYMNRMNAYIYDPIDNDIFKSKTTKFQAAKVRTHWEEFDAYVTTQHPLPQSQMIELYNASTSWLAFFNSLKTALKNDMKILCEYMYPWITTFIQHFANLRFTAIKFAIPLKNPKISRVEYTLRVYVPPNIPSSGIGKQTRKQYKRRKAVDLR